MQGLEQLKSIPLFQSVTQTELAEIRSILKIIPIRKGETIISEGEVGDCLYIIRSGKAKVVSYLKGNDQIVLSYLTVGDYFGEMSLITGEPRSATVLAEEDGELWQLDKKDFDDLLMKNPSITLSLTHMLSQRLSLSNRARESSERYYKQRISPRGLLSETDLIKLLKYAEEISLSGKIKLTNNTRKAIFNFKKGQLEDLDFEGKEEDQAMDELLDWNDGEFVIEPDLYQLSGKPEEPTPEKILEDNLVISHIEKYLQEKVKSLIKYAGAHPVQLAINTSLHKFSRYFDVADQFKIETEPQLKIYFHTETWTEKHTLFLAVLMRDLVDAMERDLIGMSFWKLQPEDARLNTILEENQFFLYYEQAADFVGA